MSKLRVTRTSIVTEEVIIEARDPMAPGERARYLSAAIDDGRALFEQVGEVISILRVGDYEGHSLGADSQEDGLT